MADRVVVIGGPWPERIGCKGTTVDRPEGYNGFPWYKKGTGEGTGEVAVLLDDDPISTPRDYGGAAVSCVYSVAALAWEATIT